MSKAEIEARIIGMIEEIEQARVNISQGKDIGLERIGERVTEACADATSLPDEDAVLMKPLLEELQSDLVRFSDELGEIDRRLKEHDAQEAAKAAAQANNEDAGE